MPLGNSIDTQKTFALWQLGFRPFFLFASLFSIIALILWIALLSGELSLTPYGGGLWWHTHEMLFGFVAPIVVGFLLTAVQNWSGIPGVKGGHLMLLIALWLTARLAFWLVNYLPLELIAALDLIFLPLATVYLANPIIKKRLYRNLMFIPLLALMSWVNYLMHRPLLNLDNPWFLTQLNASQAAQVMVFLVILLIALMGGRVIPMFTANGTQTRKVAPIAWLEILTLIVTAITPLIFLLDLRLNNLLMAALMMSLALLHMTRLLRWRFWVTYKVPLVWSLHLSYSFIGLGFLLLFVHYAFQSIAFSTALHLLTVGAIGTMILAMIARVSLGHTGRLIKVGKGMVLAFAALILAALSRSFLPLINNDYLLIMFISAVAWCVGYGIFVFQYWFILWRPRIDGRPG